MSIDRYFNRQYHPVNYNCAHFVCEVWSDLRGKEFAQAFQSFLCGKTSRRSILNELRIIRFLKKPESPCVVFLNTPVHEPHVGVWISGRVLHIGKEQGVQYQPLDIVRLGYKKVRFLTC